MSEWESRLERLLGPPGPELQCDECFDRLDAYVDAELAGLRAESAAAGLREHLSGCAACREEYESLHDLTSSKIRIAGS